MKFRKKPVVIDAVRYLGPEHHQSIAGTEIDLATGKRFIQTLEGEMEVSPGDWVITGVKGERYPCKDDIFRLTYDPIYDECSGW